METSLDFRRLYQRGLNQSPTTRIQTKSKHWTVITITPTLPVAVFQQQKGILIQDSHTIWHFVLEILSGSVWCDRVYEMCSPPVEEKKKILKDCIMQLKKNRRQEKRKVQTLCPTRPLRREDFPTFGCPKINVRQELKISYPGQINATTF